MGDAVLGKGVEESAGDMVLPGDIGKTLGTIFAGKDLIPHGRGLRWPAS
jgi:hypothetical protein